MERRGDEITERDEITRKYSSAVFCDCSDLKMAVVFETTLELNS